MSTPHNKVSLDLRNQILERVKTSGKSIAEISYEHGIGKTTIYEWLLHVRLQADHLDRSQHRRKIHGNTAHVFP